MFGLFQVHLDLVFVGLTVDVLNAADCGVDDSEAVHFGLES